VILRTKGRLRMVVSVTMLRRSIAVELDREEMVPLPGRDPRSGLGRELTPAA
jgi:hypothetical protein